MVKRIRKIHIKTINVIINDDGGAEYGNGGDDCDDEFCTELLDIASGKKQIKKVILVLRDP